MTLRRRRDIWDVVIIGGGIAGLTAAWHAMRRGLATTLFESAPGCGGQVATTETIDDWPATGPVSGVALAAALVEQLYPEIVELHYEAVATVRSEGDLLRVESASHSLRARRVIAASGGRLRTLGVPGEQALRGKGVTQCAHCDGHFFRNQDVVVVGGGDAALQEALVLAELARSVSIVARSRLRARHAFIERAAGKPQVRFVWDSVVDAVLGEADVTGVRVRNLRSGETMTLNCTGVFPFVGIAAQADFLPPSVMRDAAGRVQTDADLRTAEPRIYAIGALRAGYAGDLVNAAGEAAAAVSAVARELSR